MEEIDNIIIHSLRQIGCNLDEEVSSVGDFTPELVIEAASRCLNIIQPNLDLPLILPANMAMRFKATAAIATACKDVGYNGDIGYQAFLYSNESDLRKIFMFLIEHLPKDADKEIVSGPKGLADELLQNIAHLLHKQLTAPFLFSQCKPNGFRVYDSGILCIEGRPRKLNVSETKSLTIPQPYLPNVCQAFKNYWVKYLPFLKDQIDSHSIIQSVISHNDKNLGKTSTEQDIQNHLLKQWNKINNSVSSITGDVNSHSVDNFSKASLDIKAIIKNEVNVNEQQAENEAEVIVELANKTETMNADIGAYACEIVNYQQELQKLLDDRYNEDNLYKKAIDKYELIVKSRTLLDNREENLLKLQNKAEASAKKLIHLSKQWEEHKLGYMEQYQAAKNKANFKSSEHKQLIESLENITQECDNIISQINLKSNQQAQLSKEYENANKDINRSAYTNRILEIIGSIGKQKTDLNRVLNETRTLQKEINNLTGRLQRSFTETDELIFEDARRHELGRTAYKLLATLHTDCKSLVETVEATGGAVRESRELEDHIQQESNKRIADSLARVKRDLDSMRMDSAELKRLIEQKQSNAQ